MLTVGVIPDRVFPRPPVPGLSLVLGPIAAGGMMHALGRAQAANGRTGSRLATFWGGALFAVTSSLVRLLLLAECGQGLSAAMRRIGQRHRYEASRLR